MPAIRASITHALVLVTVAVVSIPGTGVAQTPGQETVELSLIGQPTWHGEDDPLALQLRVSNQGLSTLDGFRLQVGAYPPAGSRSALHSNFDIDPLSVELSSLSVELDTSVPAGTSTVITIDDPVSNLSSIAGEPAGVYPLTVTVTAPDGFTALDAVTTQLLYFPDEVEVPLNVVLLWPLVDLPSRAPGGTFTPDPDQDQTHLEAAIAGGGWLEGALDALDARYSRHLRMGLSPEGRLVEELRDMSDGYRRAQGEEVISVPPSHPSSRAAAEVLGKLKTFVGHPRIQPVITPYAYPDLTSLDDFEQLSAQLTTAGAELEESLDVTPERAWLFPPAGHIDAITLERLRSTDAAASTFFSNDSVAPPVEGVSGCREDFVGITFTCPIKVATTSGAAHGFVLDPELQQRFGALVSAPADIVELQKLFAEIAMIWAELPGTSSRVVALAVPPLWHPPPSISTRFVRAMATAPWIKSRTPRGGLHLGVGAVSQDLITDTPRHRSQPDPAYFVTIEDAAATVESFARIRPPVPLVQRLQREVLVAQSLLWWADSADQLETGTSFATGAREVAEGELNKISIGGTRDITLTSRKGTVPLALQNGTDYDVTLEIRLESDDRDLEIDDRVFEQTFAPGATALPIQASARASGIYPVGVSVVTGDGFAIYETEIRIRSTEFNEIALAITIGALIFLIAFSLVRGIRRRTAPAATEETE
jgi:hypothetical protein